MAGSFEVFVDADSLYRFRLLAPDGMVMAVSQGFADKRAVAAGIAAVRECAAGAVARPVPAAAPTALPADTQPDCGHRAAARAHTFTLAKGPRRPALSPRWTRALAP